MQTNAKSPLCLHASHLPIQLETLDLQDSLPDLAALVLPTSLQELSVDRVGEHDGLELYGSTEGWDELPPSLSALARLRRLSVSEAGGGLLACAACLSVSRSPLAAAARPSRPAPRAATAAAAGRLQDGVDAGG